MMHDQTILTAEGQVGNCFQAALATVLRMPTIDAVPHFVLLGMHHWMSCCIAWLNANGYEVSTIKDACEGMEMLPLCIIRGISPRGIGHAVVGDAETGEMIHDPHPSRAGLTEINSRFYLFRIPKVDTA